MRVYVRELNSHLPYLRRYARALTGATHLGDDLVTRGVEAAVMAPTRFGIPGPKRAPLYALLNLLFDADGEGRPMASPHPIEQVLARLPEPERRLYLLTALEELPLAEAAAVEQMVVEDAAERLCRVRERLRCDLTARVMVVEENPILALDLGSVVTEMGHVVCGTAATESEAMVLADTEQPTLALLDVRLADGGSGIEVARKLHEKMSALRVIFVTGNDGEIERLNQTPLGPVVRKPFSAEAVRAAITRIVFMPRPVACA